MEQWKVDENQRVKTCWGHARIAIFCFTTYFMIMSIVGLGYASYVYETGNYYYNISWNAELVQAAIAGCVMLLLVNVGLVFSMFWRILILMDFWLLYHLFILLLHFALFGVFFVYHEWLTLLLSIPSQIINWYAVKVVYNYYVKVRDNLYNIKKPRVTFQISTE